MRCPRCGNGPLEPSCGKSIHETMRPGIIVIVPDDADSFQWVSDGWHTMKKAGTPEAKRIMARAREIIDAASDVPDAMQRLEAAGFKVTRQLE